MRLRLATDEGVTSVFRRASAHGCMIDDVAGSSKAAGSRAGISALFVNARQMALTFGMDDAFRPAVGRTADVAASAGTGWRASDIATLGVRSARRRHTRINVILNGNRWRS